MSAVAERERYVSDGGVSWAMLPALLAGSAAAALAGGYLMNCLFAWGWYLIILVPWLTALLLGLAVAGLVAASRCRNRWLAGAVGFSAGLGAYLAYFYFGLWSLFPPGLVPRPEMLPRYVMARLATDVQHDVGKPNARERKPSVWLNGIMFAFELSGLIGIPASLAWARARRAYSPELRLWAVSEEKLLHPYLGEAMRAALDDGTIAEFLRGAPTAENQQLASCFAVEWFNVPDDSPLNEPIYVSISDHRQSGFLRHIRRSLVRQAALTPQEALHLRPVLPKLAAVLDVRHPELQVAPAQVFAAAPRVEGEITAEVISVPEPFRQKVRTKNYSLIVNLLGAVELVNLALGAGLLALGGWLLSKEQFVGGNAALAGGGGFLGWAIYVSQCCMGVRENRWIDKRLRQEFARRPDPIVDLADPALKYVALMPRESFTKVKWIMSSDLALMRIDDRRNELRLEGDIDRYFIPAAAILACESLCFFHPLDAQHNTQLWMVRLLIRRDTGEQELLLSVPHLDWKPRTNAGRQRVATAICEEINSFRFVIPNAVES